MRKLLILTVALAASSAAVAAAASAPAVPRHSQLAIKHRTVRFAYVPARIPVGWRYYKWTFAQVPPTLRITFRDKAAREITFTASRQDGPCAAGRQKTFQLDGNKVYWSQGSDGQQAWRCVTGRLGGTVRLSVGTTIPPTKFADVGLGIVAASGHYVR